ncbi:MFS transporter [Streptococcus danieliae]|uniref:MFS transporter n=1 Tax=Streptococcus danieliae TaxID=747656 RepID=UPI0021C7BE94|nr:MFS transporter [Streptococcus danieliae]MCU0082890.1 MFS transporter [Streptococcus danieliae]
MLKSKTHSIIYMYGFWSYLFFERSIWSVYLLAQGINAVQIGLLQTVLSFAMFLFELPSGVLSDRFGEKFTLFIGHSLTIAYLLIMWMSPNIYMLVFAFFLYGFGLSMISGSDQTLLYNQEGEKSYQEKIGVYNAISIASLALSSFLGGIFSQESWVLVFIAGIVTQLVAIFTLLGVASTKQNLADYHPENSISIQGILKSLKQVLIGKSKLKYLLIGIATFQAVLSVLYNFVQLLFVEKGQGAFEISMITTLGLIVAAISSMLMNALNNRFTTKKIVITSLTILLAIGFLFKLKNIAVIIVICLIYEFIYELVDTSLNATLHEEVEDQVRTSLISTGNTLTSFLMLISNFLFTILVNRISVSSLFLMGIFITVLVTSFCLRKYYQ